MKKLWGILFFLLFIATLSAQNRPAVEKLKYTGYYNWGFIWVKAGAVELVTESSNKYKGAMKLEAVGYSNSSWDWVFKLRDTLIAHYDPNTFLTYESSRRAHEGNYHKTFNYYWDYDSMCIFADIHRIGKYRKRDTISLCPNTYDMLTVAWKARELSFDNYRKGDTIPINVLIDDKICDLYVRYLGTDILKLGGVKRDCYLFAPMLVEGDVFKGGEDMKVWISKDAMRVPLMIEAKILVGSVKGILEGMESSEN